MDEKSIYQSEIARMKAEDPIGNAETIRMMEEEMAEPLPGGGGDAGGTDKETRKSGGDCGPG